MADIASRDQNRVTALLAASSSDREPTKVYADPTDHTLGVHDGTTGSSLGGNIAARDGNRVPVLLAVSSADGVTPVEVYADPTTNELLVDST